MKVLHIITGLNDGGAEAVLYRMCHFDKDNQHIVISLMDKGKYGSMLDELGVDVFTLNMPTGKIKFSGLLELYQLIKKQAPDTIQTWMYHADFMGGLVGRLAGIKNIVWGVHHTTLVKGESKRSTILIAKVNAFLSKFIPNKIIYCAEKSRAVQEDIGFKKTIGCVVPNGYDVDDFIISEDNGQKFRQELGISSNEFLIGHVGRYDPQKDQANLIDALRQVKRSNTSFKTVLIGTNLDSQNKILNSLISEKGLENQIMLIGRRNDIPSVMNGLDLFVLPSAFGEAFPNVLNEAMACGTPCVATDVGDSAVIINKTGWITPPKQPIKLAECILEAINEKNNHLDTWLLRKKDARARIVENFSIEKMVESYKKVWLEGISN